MLRHRNSSNGNTAKKKRLLTGVTLSEVGGCQKVVFDLLTNLPEMEYDITLVTSPGGELLDWINDRNTQRSCRIRVVELSSLKRNISPGSDLKTLLNLIRILKKGKYDIAHFHSSKIGLLGRVAAKLTRVPQVYYTVHGWGLHAAGTGLKFKLLGKLEKLAGRLSTKVICVSEHDLAEGIQNGWIKRKKACVIHNGIRPETGETYDIHREYQILGTAPVLASVERLQEPKDPLFTIRTAEYLKQAGFEFRLLIIGDGILRKDCEELIDKLGLSEQVFLLGSRRNVREILQSVDIFLLFTHWEGLPVSVIEAMFAGKPVVASNVGGIPELITQGYNGYLLDGFSEKQASGYILPLLTDRGLREELGGQGRKTAFEKFSLEEMVGKYRNLYCGMA